MTIIMQPFFLKTCQPLIVSQSNDPLNDGLLGSSLLCGHASEKSYQDRCGYGARLPLLAISPYSKVNYIDHSVTDQPSILTFIEDNCIWEELIINHLMSKLDRL
jgi:phospholipase C